MSDLPKFEPLPNVGNVVSNRVTSFNQGYNLYQCINYLQGYVSIVYENMDALLDDWNNFQKVINENIDNIATEETQKILNQWLEDGTLNNLIAQNPLWNQKLDRSGGTMTGNIKFSENTKIVGTTPGGNDIDLIHNTNDGASGNYVQFGDPDAKSVINSNQQPVWHNGDDDYLLLTQKQMDDGLAGKVSKSGDTMTGDLGIIRLLFNNVPIISPSNTTTILGSSTRQTTINSNNKPLFNYGGSNKTPLVTNDVVNNLTSSSTTQPLSAAQGKALNDKINNVQGMFGTATKLYFVSKVIAVTTGTVVTTVYTQDELKEMLGITNDSGFSNRITAAVINGAKNTNAANIVACNYEETTKELRIKCEDAQSGSLRVNLFIAYAAGIVG